MPMSPTLSPSSRLKLASVKSSLRPKSFLIDRRVKIVSCIESHLPDESLTQVRSSPVAWIWSVVPSKLFLDKGELDFLDYLNLDKWVNFD